MDETSFIRYLRCYDLPAPTRDRFGALLQELNKGHQEYMTTGYQWHDSGGLGSFPTEKWKSSKEYTEFISSLEFFPFIRREYLISLKKPISGNHEELSHRCWEEIIREMTGGKLDFHHEIPAMTSDTSKAAICGLNIKADTLNKINMSNVRSGRDYTFGYLLRLDRAIGDKTLELIVKHKILVPG